MAKITLIGLSDFNDHLFDGLRLPEEIDRDTLIGNILIKGGDFEVLYPDAVFMQEAIGIWAKKWERTFSKWVEGLKAEYNPIENYDRFEDWTDTGSNSNKVTAYDISNAAGNGSNEDKRSSYDSDAYTPHNKTDSYSDSHSDSSSNSTATGDRSNVHSAHIHGNIGVTTAPAMLREFFEISGWNIYEHITDVFLQEFIIPVY